MNLESHRCLLDEVVAAGALSAGEADALVAEYLADRRRLPGLAFETFLERRKALPSGWLERLIAGSAEATRAVPDLSIDDAAPTPGRSAGGAPRTIGRCKIVRKIGRGGLGVVYEGHHPFLGKKVAIKVISPALAADVQAIERFLREARVLAELDDPHVVRVLDAGEEEGRYFITMEYLKGKDLATIVHERGPLPWEKAVKAAEQAARGLGAMHRKGIFHRDVKPHNLMVAGGIVKVIDLGLARPLEPSDVTEAGQVIGTPAFMSPEQLKGDELDHTTDVYSLGISLYFLLTGRVPFEEKSLFRLIKQHDELPLPPAGADGREVPGHVEELLARLTAKTPAQRPQDMLEVAAQLRQARGAGDTRILPVRRRRFFKVAAALALVVVGAGALAAGLLGVRSRPGAGPSTPRTGEPEGGERATLAAEIGERLARTWRGKVRVTPAGDGRFRLAVEYDFSDRAQLRDFSKDRGLGRWRIKKGGIRLPGNPLTGSAMVA